MHLHWWGTCFLKRAECLWEKLHHMASNSGLSCVLMYQVTYQGQEILTSANTWTAFAWVALWTHWKGLWRDFVGMIDMLDILGAVMSTHNNRWNKYHRNIYCELSHETKHKLWYDTELHFSRLKPHCLADNEYFDSACGYFISETNDFCFLKSFEISPWSCFSF